MVDAYIVSNLQESVGISRRAVRADPPPGQAAAERPPRAGPASRACPGRDAPRAGVGDRDRSARARAAEGREGRGVDAARDDPARHGRDRPVLTPAPAGEVPGAGGRGRAQDPRAHGGPARRGTRAGAATGAARCRDVAQVPSVIARNSLGPFGACGTLPPWRARTTPRIASGGRRRSRRRDPRRRPPRRRRRRVKATPRSDGAGQEGDQAGGRVPALEARARGRCEAEESRASQVGREGAGPPRAQGGRQAGRCCPKAKAKTRTRTAAPPRPRRAPRPGGTSPEPPRPSSVVLTEEEQIEAAKYLPRELPRLFEEERFIFPESYGQSRIRLLVKDPEWLFAHWDVDPQSLARVRQELGERASALSRLTLRVTDPHNGGESRHPAARGRALLVRARGRRRAQLPGQLGLTLPSGEFRSLAESNTVRTPRSGPSAEGAPRRARYDGADAWPPARRRRASSSPWSSSAAAGQRESAPPAAGPGPWRPEPATAGYPGTPSARVGGGPRARPRRGARWRQRRLSPLTRGREPRRP